jgi:hypothetical protein
MQLVALPPSFSCVCHDDLSFLLPWALPKMIDEFDKNGVFCLFENITFQNEDQIWK